MSAPAGSEASARPARDGPGSGRPTPGLSMSSQSDLITQDGGVRGRARVGSGRIGGAEQDGRGAGPGSEAGRRMEWPCLRNLRR